MPTADPVAEPAGTDPPGSGAVPIVIPAHGRGSRLHAVTGGRPKALLDVAGQTLLGRLVRAAKRAPGHHPPVFVYAPPEDRTIPAFLAAHAGDGQVRLGRRAPHGYLPDVVAISAELGDELTVLDSDVLVPEPDLGRFLASARSGHRGEHLVVGVSAWPPSTDPRSIRFVPDGAGGTALAPGEAAGVPRSAGLYHWCPAGLQVARAFVAAGRGSFHDFIADLVASGGRVRTIELPAALNVNTPADLGAAAEALRSWRAAGWEPVPDLDEPAPTGQPGR